ncbi:MAG TPA: NAD(P)-dependent oxidoreductase [Candidatus Obscuribacterales bacterium]
MTVGFIGTGLMGLPMAERLLATDRTVIAYNRTQAKLEPLNKAGAAIAQSPVEVLQQAECVLLMLTDATAIQTVLLSPEARPAIAGRTIIQMGTIAPSESRAIAAEVEAAGGDYLEAPVLGSIPEAQAGNLIVMVGSSPEQFQRWLSLLQQLGPEPQWIGEVGSAAALKLALNQLIGSLTTAFALSLGFVMQQGVEVETFMNILRDSALYAPTFDKKLQRMVERNYANPNFPTKHLLKDMSLFLGEAQSAGLNVSSLEGVRAILQIAQKMGLAEADYSALFSAVSPED